MSKLSVLRPVDGGGGAHGSEAVEQTDDEKDQAVMGGADAIVFKGAVLQAAADVQVATGAENVGGEGGSSPHGGRREKVGLTSNTAYTLSAGR